jgi:hypothetical protein
MDGLQLEVMAEERRLQLIHAMRQVRLEQGVERNSSRPGWFARSMVSVGLWMIAFGEQLRRRYAGPWIEAQPVQHSFSMEQR